MLFSKATTDQRRMAIDEHIKQVNGRTWNMGRLNVVVVVVVGGTFSATFSTFSLMWDFFFCTYSQISLKAYYY